MKRSTYVMDGFMKDSENYGVAVTGERLTLFASWLRRTFPEDFE